MATAKKQLVIAQVGAATALVQAGNILGAHDALKVIADNEGDGALKEALQKVPPSDLGQILVGTATLPSAILAELVTPEPFLKALLEVPKKLDSRKRGGCTFATPGVIPGSRYASRRGRNSRC